MRSALPEQERKQVRERQTRAHHLNSYPVVSHARIRVLKAGARVHARGIRMRGIRLVPVASGDQSCPTPL